MTEEIDNGRRRFLGKAAMTILGARLGVLSPIVGQTSCGARELPVKSALSSLGTATHWLNSEPLTATELRGRVVLIDFCTYTCINWLRTLPYVRAWAEKYKDDGLVVVSVHTPEFPFEKNLDNVRAAMKEMAVNHPLAIDNDYAIWKAFDNHYWPAQYFADPTGRIRHHHFGEGAYEQSEKTIQRLLAEGGGRAVKRELVSVEGQGAEAPADWNSLKSPENYLGYVRTGNFASPGGVSIDKPHQYASPAQLGLNQWSLAGNWTIGRGSVLLNEAGGRIACRFHARDVHLVMGPSEPGKSLAFRVLIDGRSPGDAHGSDVDDHGSGVLSAQRMYQLIRQPKPIGDRQFVIEFLDSGAEAFAFTFG